MNFSTTKSLFALTMSAVMMTGCSKEKPVEAKLNTENATSTNASTSATTTANAFEEKYVVGIDVTYPPFTSLDEKGRPTGFEVEVLEAIANDQKFGVELLHTARSSLYPDLESGKYQILAASLKPNPERLSKSDFTDGFAKSHHTILSHKDKMVKSGKELAGAKVSAQEATNTQKKLEAVGAQVVVYPTQFESFRNFFNGNVDYTSGDSIVLNYYLSQHAKDKIANYTFTPFDSSEGDTQISFAVTKGNTKLLEKMNTGLANIKRNGKYDEIYNKYFTDSAASTNYQ